MLTHSLVLFWLTALVFYWLVPPESNGHTLAGIILSYMILWHVVFLWGNAAKNETAKRFFLSTMSVALTVGLLEALVLAKIVDYRVVLGTPVWEPWAHPGNLVDPTLLHIHKPHDRWLWNGIDYRYDQYGLRNEVDLEAADIVMIGDSFTEGLGVSATDLITSHLARQLDRTVANLGQSWYGPQQELELLKRYGLLLRPKVCVWAFFEGNDLDDVHRYKEATRDWEKFSKNLHSFRQRSFTKNFLLAVQRLLGSVHRGNNNKADPAENRSGIFEESSGKRASLYFRYEGHYLSDRDYRALEELGSILSQANELCRTDGAEFLVVFVPTKFRVYKRFTEFDTHMEPRYWVINDIPKRLEAIVRQGLPDGEFIDLTGAFTEHAKHGSLTYFTYDSHLSPLGHRVAAAAISKFLMRRVSNDVSARHR